MACENSEFSKQRKDNTTFRNNEKRVKYSDLQIATGWHGEQWDFQNNEKPVEYNEL